jgi:hypothetical protein
MTTHELARLLLAGGNLEIDIQYIPVRVLGLALCSKCKGPRPRTFGRRLCWYCQHPKRKSTRSPDPISRPPKLSLDGTQFSTPPAGIPVVSWP